MAESLPPTTPERWWHWLACLAVGILAAVLLFQPALSYDFQTYDDHFFVRDNPNLAPGLTVNAVQWALTANLFGVEREAEYWMPLTLLSRLLDVSLFGTKHGGWFHLQNILLHGINAGLIFLVLFRATSQWGRSFCVATLHLVHPLMMEIVGWVALRKDILSATFCLLTLLAYLSFARSRRGSSYLLALGAFACALASKPSSISFPLALLLFDLWPLQRLKIWDHWKIWAERIIEKVPFVLLAVASAGLTFVGQSEAGTAHGEWEYTWAQRLISTAVGFVEYLQRLVIPNQLCVLYPLPPPGNLSVTEGLLAGTALLLLTVLFGLLAWRRYLFGWVGWLWFIGLTLPVTGLVQFGRQATADRYMYLPLIGLLFALVWAIAELWQALTDRFSTRLPLLRPLGATVFAGVVIAFSLQARHQLSFWGSSLALWERAASIIPDHVYALRMIGRELTTQGQEKPGQAYSMAALKLAPNRVDTQATVGIALALNGKHAEALPYLNRAIKMAPLQLSLHNTLVLCLERLGRNDEAKRARVRMNLIRLDAFVRKALEFIKDGEPELARGQIDAAWGAVSEARDDAKGARLFREETKFWKEVEQGLLAYPLRPGHESDLPYVKACVRYFQVGAAPVVQDFEEMTRSYPLDPDPWWRLALCRRELGDQTGAEKAAAEARSRTRGASDPAGEWKRVLDREAARQRSGS